MGMQQLLFIAVMIALFWFLIIRPQQQRNKKQQTMLSAIKPGDEIVTIGGIFGTVVDVDERIRVRVYDGGEIEVARQAIGQVIPADEQAALDEPSDEEAAETTGEEETTPDA